MYSKLSGWEYGEPPGMQIEIDQTIANYRSLTRIVHAGVPVPKTALRKALGGHGIDE